MTIGAEDALFDQDGTTAADRATGDPPAARGAEPVQDGDAGEAGERADSGATAEPPPAPAAARTGAPTWLSGQATSPWPPPEATVVPPGSAVTPAAPRRPVGPVGPAPARVPGPPPRPRIVEEPGILGLSRLTRGRFGSRLFTLFFVLVYALIAVQMVVSILDPW